MKILLLLNLLLIFSCNAQEVDKGFVYSGIALEKSTFKDVFKSFKKMKINHRGDASNSLSWVCYKYNNSFYVQFSSGEMGGGNYITEITLSTKTTPKYITKNTCQKIDRKLESLSFQNGIGLSSDMKSIVRALGKAKQVKGKKHIYSFEKTLKNDFVEIMTVEINYDAKNAIENISVFKVTSN